MSSLVKGYEYDIFVSYRQKDNKYDGWVTEFLANLRKELEATFKEDISIYSDENKFDGLSEINQVDESLASKLKCIIFMPILSHTYCDQKSYAWKNEFLVFRESAAADPFGLMIRMPNGNVTSRIVPIRIHDLDRNDRSLFEEALGGSLRSIDFVFRAQGVNRPLRSHEDRPNDNLNKTYYRDQINKVANLVREIIHSIRAPDTEEYIKSDTREESQVPVWKAKWRNLAIVATIAVAGTISLFYYFSNGADTSPPIEEKVSIVVLPFKAIGKEEDSQYFADGVMEVILSKLTYFPELTVKSGIYLEKYSENSKQTLEIARELRVLYVLKGSAQKLGEDIRIVVQLVDVQADVNIWSESFVRKFSNVFEIQNEISEEVARTLKARLTPDISARIERQPTTNFESYDLFLKAKLLSKRYESGRNPADLVSAIDLLKKSVRKDDQFAEGYAWLAGLMAIHDLGSQPNPQARDSILLLANRAVEIDSTIVESYLVLGQVYNYLLDNVNALRYSYKALETIPDDSTMRTQLILRLASIYSRVGEVDRALYLYEKLEDFSPGNPEILSLKFIPLAAGGRIEKLTELAEEVDRRGKDVLLQDLIMTHVFTQRQDFESLEKTYFKHASQQNTDWSRLDQYIMIYAVALKKNGKGKEAGRLINMFESEFALDDPYLQAQLLVYNGRIDAGLKLLESVEIGSYNLTLCSINPVFDSVRKDPRFREFIERNRTRIIDNRERINQLESKGLLPRSEDFFRANAII